MNVPLLNIAAAERAGSGVTTATPPDGSIWQRAFNDVDEQAACIASLYPQRYQQLGTGRFAGHMTASTFMRLRRTRDFHAAASLISQ